MATPSQQQPIVSATKISIDLLHSFLIHPGKGAENAHEINGATVPNTGKLFEMLRPVFDEAEEACSHKIAFNSQNGQQENDFRDALITHIKNCDLNHGRDIAKRNHLPEILSTWRPNPQQLIFATRNGTPWDANLLVKRKFRPMLRQLNIQESGLHAFRHADASLMDELSVPMKVRQQRLGHSDPRLTMNTYTHMASCDDERIAEQLGEILDAVGQNAVEITKGKGPAFQQALLN